MDFGIIYSFDCPRDESVAQFMPRNSIRRKLHQTEGDEGYEYGYLGGCWTKGKHRKLVGILSKKDFIEFVSDTGLSADGIENGGILGAPWSESGFGWAPAICFMTDESSLRLAYVTPLINIEPSKQPTEERCERVWERVKQAVLNQFR